MPTTPQKYKDFGNLTERKAQTCTKAFTVSTRRSGSGDESFAQPSDRIRPTGRFAPAS